MLGWLSEPGTGIDGAAGGGSSLWAGGKRRESPVPEAEVTGVP